MVLTLDSCEWLNEVQPYGKAKQSPEDVEKEIGVDSLSLYREWKAKIEDSEKCTACNFKLDFDDRASVAEHYQSNWHRLNLKKASNGVPPVSEEDFEEGSYNDEDTGEVEKFEEDVDSWTPGGRAYFVQNENVYSVPRCILCVSESEVTSVVLSRPLNCSIFLLSGGHFAAGVFEGSALVAHRAFHRYVVRAKQGGAQSQYDNAHGNAKSAGAALRRYNENKMKSDIANLVKEWEKFISKSPLIFIRCASYQKSIFHEEVGGISRKDPRLRTIPFETQRPTLDEVRRTWSRLKTVESHGSLEQFKAEMNKLVERKRRLENLQRKKKISEGWTDDEEDDDNDKKENNEQKGSDHIKVRPVVEQSVDEWPAMSDDWRKKVYSATRNDDVDSLTCALEDCDQQQALSYLQKKEFTQENLSFLHVSASRGSANVLKFLLEKCDCDPCAKDANGRPPYSLSANKAIKDIFVQFRSENPQKFNWMRSHIPEPVVLTTEQLEKLAEKKKARRDKQKEKTRQEKEATRKADQEREEKERWLRLSERERRAIIVERRLAGLAPIPRCEQCADVIPAQPFEYGNFKFCSTSCVSKHRGAN